MISRLLLLLVALVAPLSALAQVTKPPINAVAGPTTSAQLQSIITDATGSGALNFGPSAAASLAIGIPLTGGTPNGLLYNNADTLGNLATTASGMLITDSSGLPSISNIATLVDTMITFSGSVVTGQSLSSTGGIVSLKTINAQPVTTDFGNVFQLTATVNASETSDVRLMQHRLIMQGVGGADRFYGQYNGVEINNTVGTQPITIINTNHNYVENFGSVPISFAIPVFAHVVNRGTSDITEARVYSAGAVVFGTSGGRIPTLIGYDCSLTGDAALVDSIRCYQAANATSTGGVVGFQSNVLPGTGKFGFVNAAGADNSFKGITTFSRDPAVADAGNTDQVKITVNYTGDPGGTTSMRGLNTAVTATGSQNIATQFNRATGWVNNASAGTTGSGAVETASITMANAAVVTNMRGITIGLAINGAGGITDYAAFQVDSSTFSSTGTITTLEGFRANGTGDAAKVTFYRGFRAADASASSAVEGFLGQVTSGTGKRNLSMTGSADNVIVGNTNFGANATTAFTVNVQGTLNVTGAATFGSASFSASTITSSSANAFDVGPNGTTNPVLQVDASTASQAAGLKLTGAVAAGTVDLSVISSGGAANFTLSAKGTGTMGIGAGSTGRVTITPVTTITGALTLSAVGLVYDGKTLTGSTGTGNMVLSASPTLSGTVGGALTFAGALTLSAALTYGGVTLTNAVTGIGKMVLDTQPTLTNLSDAAVSDGLILLNGGSSVGTGTEIVLAPTATNRTANLQATANGGAITFNLLLSNGAAPATRFSVGPTGGTAVTSPDTVAFAVGPNGASNPAFQVQANAGSLAAGLKVAGAGTGGNVTISVTDSGSNANLFVDAKGTGTMTFGNSSTGAITMSRAITLSAALTYGGVTLNNSVQGTGSMVLSASPTLTGTLTAAAANFSAAVAITSASATSFTVGLNGATNSVFQVDSSTGSQAAGLKLTGAVTGGTVALVTIDSGAATNLTVNAKGTGTIGIGTVSTGVITLGAAVTLSNATLTFTNLATDATHTTRTVCQDTTSKILFFGSGAAGICLGTSSARFKTNILPETTGLAQIAQLNPVHFSYLKGYGDDGARVQKGFLAEEVAGVMPELVGYDEQGRPNTVDWAGMVPVLVNAVKELKASNDNLRVEVETLKRASR